MPNSLRLDLLNAADWNLTWDEVVVSSASLNNLLSPTPFESSIIAVEVDNPEKQETWVYAGILTQKANLAAFGKGIEPIYWKKIFLGAHTLIHFEIMPSTSYRLEFNPAEWHKQIKIRVWEYLR